MLVRAQKPTSQRAQQTLGQILIHAILLPFSFACLLPLVLVIAASLSDEQALSNRGYGLLPRQFSLAHRCLLADHRHQKARLRKHPSPAWTQWPDGHCLRCRCCWAIAISTLQPCIHEHHRLTSHE